MKCRPYDESDLSYLVEMYRQLRIDEQQPDERTDAEICQQFHAFMNTDAYQCFFWANGQDELLGYMLFKESEQGVFLKHLFVLPAYRRQGHARNFLTHFIDGAWFGKPISLEVLAVNRAAIAFYQSMSFLLHSHLYTRPVQN